MADKTNKSATKRLPKGERAHIRRLKQAARKEAVTPNLQSVPAQPVKAPKKQEQV